MRGNSLLLLIYFYGLMMLLASLAMMRRTIGTLISTSDQEHFVFMTRSSPAMLELDPRAEPVETKKND